MRSEGGRGKCQESERLQVSEAHRVQVAIWERREWRKLYSTWTLQLLFRNQNQDKIRMADQSRVIIVTQGIVFTYFDYYTQVEGL